MHPLFVIILLFSALTGYFIELMTLFAIVLVHELGHLFMAHEVGWKVKAVRLLPFGGVVEVEEAGGTSAKDELLVAIAGPLQNVWMMLLAKGLAELGWWSYEWSTYFIEANLWIALFNLLPVLPLDGGKIVQALLSYRFSYYNTLLWSIRLSVCFSAILVIYSVAPLAFSETRGIKLNELMIGTFLLFSNLAALRHIPFLFYRFILHRTARLKQLEKKRAKAYPILVSSTLKLYEALKSYHREKLNMLCVVDRIDQPCHIISEETSLQYCIEGFDVHRAVGELLR